MFHRTEDEGCHSEPKRNEGEESRPTGCSMRDSSAYGLRMTGHQNQCGELLVLSQFEFEGFRTVMPAQAGIQGDQAAASDYSAWIPAFAGMTQHSSTPQNHRDRLLGAATLSVVPCVSARAPLPV